MRTDKSYLQDMLDYIARIERASQSGKETFFADKMIQDAVIREYHVIGEIAKRISPELLATQSHIDWRSIKGFRDFLSHNYDKVDISIIWGAVEQLPELRAAVESLLDTLSDDQ